MKQLAKSRYKLTGSCFLTVEMLTQRELAENSSYRKWVFSHFACMCACVYVVCVCVRACVCVCVLQGRDLERADERASQALWTPVIPSLLYCFPSCGIHKTPCWICESFTRSLRYGLRHKHSDRKQNRSNTKKTAEWKKITSLCTSNLFEIQLLKYPKDKVFWLTHIENCHRILAFLFWTIKHSKSKPINKGMTWGYS